MEAVYERDVDLPEPHYLRRAVNEHCQLIQSVQRGLHALRRVPQPEHLYAAALHEQPVPVAEHAEALQRGIHLVLSHRHRASHRLLRPKTRHRRLPVRGCSHENPTHSLYDLHHGLGGGGRVPHRVHLCQFLHERQRDRQPLFGRDFADKCR